MASSTVTSKGQITIPKAIRERFGLTSGVVIDFTVSDDGRILVRPRGGPAGTFGALREFAPEKPVSVDEMNAAIRARAPRR